MTIYYFYIITNIKTTRYKQDMQYLRIIKILVGLRIVKESFGILHIIKHPMQAIFDMFLTEKMLSK